MLQHWTIRLALGNEHPMSTGINPTPWLKEADVVAVIDCLAPWASDLHPTHDVIQIGQNPLYSRFPVRNFAAGLSLCVETGEVIIKLADVMRPCFPNWAVRSSRFSFHSMEAVVRSRIPVLLTGLFRQRWGINSPTKANGWSPPWVTVAICSPIRPPVIRSR